MTREMQFRGMSQDTNEMIYGDLLVFAKDRAEIVITVVNNDNISVIVHRDPVKLDTVGQFIGVRDANGRRIFEGDLFDSDEAGYFDKVICYENKFILYPLGDDCVHWDKMEIIGNVHENPEMSVEE